MKFTSLVLALMLVVAAIFSTVSAEPEPIFKKFKKFGKKRPSYRQYRPVYVSHGHGGGYVGGYGGGHGGGYGGGHGGGHGGGYGGGHGGGYGGGYGW